MRSCGRALPFGDVPMHPTCRIGQRVSAVKYDSVPTCPHSGIFREEYWEDPNAFFRRL